MCDCNDGCPQVGVYGEHSYRYYEPHGRCVWCNASHRPECELLDDEEPNNVDMG